MSMKTSKKYFERFKTEFLRWQQLFGLTQYRIDFFHEKLNCRYAEMTIWEAEKAAKVTLSTEISKSSVMVDEGPEAHAKHEVIHLLINRLSWLGSCRYITDDDLGEECEAVVTRLGKVL